MGDTMNPGSPVEILARDRPCRCGCCGTDSWHRPRLLRKVRGFESADVLYRDARPGGLALRIVGRGWAKFPWGAERVIGLRYDGSGFVMWRLEEMQQ